MKPLLKIVVVLLSSGFFCISSTSCTEDDLELTDYDVLVRLYSSNPGNTLGWDLNDKTMLSWGGVTVKGDSVIALDLSYKELTSIPKAIGDLSSLTTLYLFYNNLTELPHEIGKLSSLQHLSVGYNKITQIPNEIGDLQSLISLELSHNQISRFNPEIGSKPGSLQFLEVLDISSNLIESLGDEIGNFKSLKILRANINRISGIAPQISKCSKLTEISLQYNYLVWIPQEVCNLTEKYGTKIYTDNGVYCFQCC